MLSTFYFGHAALSVLAKGVNAAFQAPRASALEPLVLRYGTIIPRWHYT